MSSTARKEAESEFDNLLGNLVDELAMTPPSQSAVSLIPEPPKARVESTGQMATEAAVAAGAIAQPKTSNNAVKVVGIIAGSLTAVAVAALLVFGGGFGDQAAPAAVVDAEATVDSQADQAAGAEAREALRLALAATQQAQADAQAADADALAKAKVDAEAAAAAAAAAETASSNSNRNSNRNRNRNRNRTKTPDPKPDHGHDFDDL